MCIEMSCPHTHPDTCNLTVRRRSFPRLPDGKEEKGEEVEDVRERRVDAILVESFLISYIIEFGD